MKKIIITLLQLLCFTLIQAQAPTSWTVNPADYSNSMVFTAVLNIESVESRNPEDLVVAFIGNEVRGIAAPNTYLSSKDRYVANLIVYSNQSSGSITFKVYNKTSNTVSDAVNEPVAFVADARIGLFDNPFIIKNNAIPTDLNLSATKIDEAKPAGTLIGILSAVDADSADNHTYSFLDGTGFADNAFFEIRNNGLYSKQFFVFNEKSSYTIQIQAEDSRKGKIAKSFLIHINDVLIENSIPTELNLSAASIDENKAAGTLIGTLSVIDADSADTHSYSLLEGAGFADNASFEIRTNELYSKEVFKFKAKSTYTIQIQAEDAGHGKIAKSFAITINDKVDEVLAFNNLITPNGDGYNDVLTINNLQDLEEGLLTIYNNNGQLVYSTNKYQNDWGSADIPSGVYYLYFKVKDRDDKEFVYKEVLRIINN